MPHSSSCTASRTQAPDRAAPLQVPVQAAREYGRSLSTKGRQPLPSKKEKPTTFAWLLSWSLVLILAQRMHPCAHSKWQRPELRRPHLHLKVHNESSNQAEGNLRDHKP